jgi:ribonuclease HI
VSGPWVLATDGAARGNPGPAGAGAALWDAQGNVVESLGVPLGGLTNNEAEYKALILGLEMALRNGAAQLTVRMDSELVVRQISGQYRVKTEHLRPLYEQVKRLIARFERCEVRHVRRGENAEADRLANAGIDSAAAAGGH